MTEQYTDYFLWLIPFFIVMKIYIYAKCKMKNTIKIQYK